MITPYFQIGPLKFHFYGLVIAIAIYVGYFLAKKRAQLYRIPDKIFDDPILLLPLIFAIIAARLYHVLDLWNYYSQNLLKIFAITNGGLGIFGGLFGAALGLFIISKIKKINFLSILDLASPSFMLGQAIGRIANWVNQEAYGPPTSLPWKIFIEPDKRPDQYLAYSYFHPTFFYEAILDAIFFFVLLLASKKFKRKGQIFALYLVLYGMGRFIVEFFRIDTWQIGAFKVAHLLAALAIIVGLAIFVNSPKNNT